MALHNLVSSLWTSFPPCEFILPVDLISSLWTCFLPADLISSLWTSLLVVLISFLWASLPSCRSSFFPHSFLGSGLFSMELVSFLIFFLLSPPPSLMSWPNTFSVLTCVPLGISCVLIQMPSCYGPCFRDRHPSFLITWLTYYSTRQVLLLSHLARIVMWSRAY